MTTAQNIAALRIQHGFTHQQIADALGMTRPAINNLENGACGLKLKNALILCDIYGLTLDELIQERAVLNEYATELKNQLERKANW